MSNIEIVCEIWIFCRNKNRGLCGKCWRTNFRDLERKDYFKPNKKAIECNFVSKNSKEKMRKVLQELGE